MILLDLAAPNMHPVSDICKNIVYSADNSVVLMTVAGGKVVYDNGVYNVGENVDTIYRECEKRKNRLLSQV